MYLQNGLAAQATFISTSGNVETVFFVNAGVQSLQVAPGQRVTSSQAVASLYQFDTTTGESILIAFCIPDGGLPTEPTLPDGALVINPNLRTAMLDALFNCDGFSLSVDIAWTGTGKLVTRHNTSIQHEPELFLNAIFHGVFQFEGTATGTVSDGFQNFTPDVTNQAPLFRFGNEQIVIGI